MVIFLLLLESVGCGNYERKIIIGDGSERVHPTLEMNLHNRSLLAIISYIKMDFEIVGEITQIETIASGSGVRERIRLSKQYGQG